MQRTPSSILDWIVHLECDKLPCKFIESGFTLKTSNENGSERHFFRLNVRGDACFADSRETQNWHLKSNTHKQDHSSKRFILRQQTAQNMLSWGARVRVDHPQMETHSFARTSATKLQDVLSQPFTVEEVASKPILNSIAIH